MNAIAEPRVLPGTRRVSALIETAIRALNGLSPIGDLALRLYVASVFWASGMTKIQTWDSTVLLFTYEYQVPLLPPEIAAYMGTFTELFFPILLAVGLGARFAALVLFVFNIIAVASYPALEASGLEQHKVWGLMLLVTLLHGPGKLSIDHWLSRRWQA